jgi:hypothetical protein
MKPYFPAADGFPELTLISYGITGSPAVPKHGSKQIVQIDYIGISYLPLFHRRVFHYDEKGRDVTAPVWQKSRAPVGRGASAAAVSGMVKIARG